MPDKWEYPWFAAWDLAFHCVALAHVDPAFAKYQLILLCREWFQHPNGALPAYEWDFGDVNPPVQAWAALEVFAIDGGRDIDFLSRVFDKLLVNFTWWVNLEDTDGQQPVRGRLPGPGQHRADRPLPPAGGGHSGAVRCHRLDGVLRLGHGCHGGGVEPHRPAAGYRTWSLKFVEHFAAISEAIDTQGLWDDTDGLFYDRLVTPDGTTVPVKVRSMVGIIPTLAAAVDRRGDAGPKPGGRQAVPPTAAAPGSRGPGASWPGPDCCRASPGAGGCCSVWWASTGLERIFTKLFDEAEFLSPYGLRAISAYHRDHPYELDVEGIRATIDYEPAESTTAMFGGNSNWRGPLWFPLNYLVVEALERYDRFFGEEFQIEYPTGSGQQADPRRHRPGPAPASHLDLPGRR